MKKTLIKLATVVIILLLIFSSYLFANSNLNKEKVLTQLTLQSLSNWHYNPVKINDQFSRTAFDIYIKSLDPAKKFFYQSDLNNLRRFQNRIDDELNEGSMEFLDIATKTLRERIQEVQGFYKELLNEPFDYEIDESLQLDPEKRNFPANKGELKELWRKLLKNQTINVYLQLVQQNENQKKVKKLTSTIDPKLEAEARQKVSRDIKRVLSRLLQEKRVDQLERYLDSITAAFDPHTTYYAPQSKEDFDIDMTGTLEGIGAQLQEEEDGDYIKVAKIIPGSPAWRGKELKEGDIIIKVAEGNGEPVDIANMRLTDVVKLIRGKKGTTVKLTIKKPTGQLKVIPIIRDVVVIEESYAKSAVIHNEKIGKSFGYISLPSFYHDFNNEQARNSADDVRKELEKLNQQKISGIILDLRNNGGGALTDAVNMTGLFIEDGPVVQVRERSGRVNVLNDLDPQVVYKGPLVVLINSLSASASEILAAALQDYGRAVIVGSNSFGKGTVQTLIDLDQFVPGNFNYAKPLGSLKLTVQKFYRITGGSTQERGVTADVVLPDLLSYYDIGEQELDNYLPYDTIKPVTYRRWERQYNLETIKANSKKRVKRNQVFSFINSNIALLEKQRKQTLMSLQLQKVLAEQETIKKQTERLEKIQTAKPYLKVVEVGKTSENKEWINQLQKDVYVEEALMVLNDIAS
ncbi:MAG TPA: carboxy terminal-processing peptidase [Bacillota bacterium]